MRQCDVEAPCEVVDRLNIPNLFVVDQYEPEPIINKELKSHLNSIHYRDNTRSQLQGIAVHLLRVIENNSKYLTPRDRREFRELFSTLATSI